MKTNRDRLLPFDADDIERLQILPEHARAGLIKSLRERADRYRMQDPLLEGAASGLDRALDADGTIFDWEDVYASAPGEEDNSWRDDWSQE